MLLATDPLAYVLRALHEFYASGFASPQEADHVDVHEGYFLQV